MYTQVDLNLDHQIDGSQAGLVKQPDPGSTSKVVPVFTNIDGYEAGLSIFVDPKLEPRSRAPDAPKMAPRCGHDAANGM